ncbi:MAG TPA: 50S ribosomal protein L3 [Candidatus Thermoplasmatota archaeon]|nr:50S ribosomal protein L3 [Candidatus Thermoplasmatota archaeon]
MVATHRPKKGSHGFSPRVRAESNVARFSSWPESAAAEPKLQGFAGYKAGMTHALMIDYRPKSITAGQEVQVPVTVLETPPMKVAAVRFYRETAYGLKTLGEEWATGLDKELGARLPVPKEPKPVSADGGKVDDVRVLAYTQPRLVTGVDQKMPDVMEIRVGGGDVQKRIAFARGLLGKDVDVTQFTAVGAMVDIAAVTKGFGFQGSPVRWGVKLQSHKNSKNRRDTTPLGPFNPGYVRPTVPMPGQTGYHQRTEYNKRVLRVGDKPEEINPAGGFLEYGLVRGTYVLLHGSVAGPARRLIRLRDATRYTRGIKVEQPQLTYVSVASKQGA